MDWSEVIANKYLGRIDLTLFNSLTLELPLKNIQFITPLQRWSNDYVCRCTDAIGSIYSE